MVWCTSLNLLYMSFSLAVEARTERGKNLTEIRNAGKLPVVMYGPKEGSVALTVDRVAFEKILKAAGESSIVTLTGLDTPKDVLIHDVAFDARKGGVVHADLYAVEAGKEITMHVPIEFTGEAPAVKLGGTLTKVMHEVEVTCMPQDIPQHILVDVSSLDDFEKQIHISDIVAPKGVAIKNHGEEVVALVQAVAEETESVEAIDMSAIAVEKKGKTDTEEAA